MPRIYTYRVYYKFEHDDTEYAVTVEETSEENARRSVFSSEPLTVTRVEVINQFMPAEAVDERRVHLNSRQLVLRDDES